LSCEEIRELIDAHADGELDLPASLTLERHLQTCPDCSRAHQNVLALRSGLRSESLYHRAPAGLRRSIKASLHTQAESPFVVPAPFGRVPSGGVFRVTTWRWLAAAACLALVAVTAFTLLQRRQILSHGDLIAGEVISSHVRSLMEPNHMLDVPSTDQHTVKPWFNGKLDFSPAVENLADEGFPLIGGRLDYLDGRSVAALVYRRNQHYINLFIWPSSGPQDRTQSVVRRQGYNVIQWDKAGMEYWAVSDLNEAELGQFAEILRGTN